MTASPTPGQSARAILGVFKSQNCIAGDPLRIGFIKAQFLENHVAKLNTPLASCMQRIATGWRSALRRICVHTTCSH
jgi:hypothetical protein